MLKYIKFLSGLALASFCTVADLPGVLPRSVVQALTVTTTSSAKPTPSSLIARQQRSGRIQVVYGETDDPLSAQLIKGYEQSQLFEQAGKLITSEIKLPHDITVALADCGEANAAYFHQEHAIVICTELMKQNYELLRQHGYSQEKALKTAIFDSVFTFFHESGHMLIHQLNLPITGREEDVADQFAAVFLLINDSEDKSMSGEIVMASANLFALQSTVPDDSDLQNEHSLNKQRFYNLVCMLYGAAPQKYSRLVAKLDYAESRLNRCQMESESILTAWKRLLQPYLKAQSTDRSTIDRLAKSQPLNNQDRI